METLSQKWKFKILQFIQSGLITNLTGLMKLVRWIPLPRPGKNRVLMEIKLFQSVISIREVLPQNLESYLKEYKTTYLIYEKILPSFRPFLCNRSFVFLLPKWQDYTSGRIPGY